MKLVRPRRKRDNQVIVDSMVHIPIKDFDPDAIAEVKDSLIFDNPAYKAAMQYSSYAYTRIPPTLSYFDSDCGILHVPLGTDLTPLNSPPFVDNRVYCRISQKYNFALKLRDEQEKAVNSFVSKNMDSYNGEFRQNGVVCLPTGKGKSIVALATAHKLRVRTLIIVHKDDLVKSWTEDIEKCFNIPRKEVGIIKAQKNKVGDFFTIATIQTLNRKSDDEIQSLSSMFGMVVTDEGHHVPASTYDVINKFAARYKMCLTATPERKDGLSHVINLYFGGFAYKYEATQKEKDILPVEVMQREFYQYVVPLCKKDDRGRWVIKDLRADPVKYVPQNRESFISDIEYNSRPKLPYADFTNLLFYMSYRWACADIVAEYKLGHSCIVFVSQKEQVEALEEYISHLPSIKPNDVQTYYGNNSDKVNEEHRKRAEEQRKLITICTYSKATEGTNVQQWECAFLIGTLNDGKNVEQAVGRIRRTKPNGEKLKVARVYDYSYPHTYSIKNHWRTRMQRYLKLGFTIHSYPSNTGDSKPVAAKKKMFTRGYHV